jgi:hypothetical protein
MRFLARLTGACLAGVLLCAGLLLATPQGGDDVPLPDDPQSSPGAPPPTFFGLTHLTPNHVARLQFANPELPGAGPTSPAVVRLDFVDSRGKVLLRKPPATVMPGEFTSLDLVAEGLEFPSGSNEIGVRGLVTFLNPQARGIASVQVEDVATGSRAALLDGRVRSPYLVRKVDPLCTGLIRFSEGSLLRINLTNAGDRGFPAAQLSADLVVYSFVPGQQEIARKTVRLDLTQSDSLTLDNIGEGHLLGTVEFTDFASRAVAAAAYESRGGADGSLTVNSMSGCPGRDSSNTSGGGGTNSGGAG